MEIVYFAWVRERAGVERETVTPPAGVETVGQLADWLATRGEGHKAAFADPARLRAAIDLNMAGFDAPIADAREVAFFPPVTGG